MEISKEERYRDLVKRARASYPIYDDTQEPSKDELYWCKECNEINLWTYWQGRGHLNARLMLVGQDWGHPWDSSCEGFMKKVENTVPGPVPNYMEGNTNPTDNNLKILFSELHKDISKPCEDLFFTNFVLGYRTGKISGNFKKAWADKDSEHFKELVNIIEPKVVLCLGRSTYEAVMQALEPDKKPLIRRYNAFIESKDNPRTVYLESGKELAVFALAHCGAIGTMNRNRGRKVGDRLELQREDWGRVGHYLTANQYI